MTAAERKARDREFLCHEVAREFVSDIGLEYDERFQAFRSFLLSVAPAKPTKGALREIASHIAVRVKPAKGAA